MNEHTPHHHSHQRGSSDRSFGLVFAAFFMIVAVWPLLHAQNIRNWALVSSVAFASISWLAPSMLAPLNRLWTNFGMLLHRFVSPLALGVLFFAVVTPIGLAMRLMGKDFLHLRRKRNTTSYWIDRVPPGPAADSLKNQF